MDSEQYCRNGQPGRRIWLCSSYAQAGVPLLASAARLASEVAAAVNAQCELGHS